MSIPIREVRSPLSHFYPDPAVRQQVHYAFAHRFLPQYVHQNPFAFFSGLYVKVPGADELDPTRFLQCRWSAIFEPQAGLVPRVEPLEQGMTLRLVADLGVELRTVTGHPAALITMPAPERPPLAHFICPVLLVDASKRRSWPQDAKCRIFTLEAHSSETPPASTGLVCEWTVDGQHRNFGVEVPVEGPRFLEAVAELVRQPEVREAGSFTPPSGASPGGITVGSPAAGQAGGAAQRRAKPAPTPPTGGQAIRPWWRFW